MIHSFNSRTKKGAVPVHIPVLILLYTIVFLMVFEFIMLFWLQSSLNTAAQQIAVKASTNNKLGSDEVEERCKLAAAEVNAMPPGYNKKVRDNYISAVSTGQAKYAEFNEITEAASGVTVRQRLIGLGIETPASFFGSSSGSQFSGCVALRNPATNQITYYTVVHCAGCWPVILKRMYMNADGGNFGSGGWLEGRGASIGTVGGSVGQREAIKLNQSLLSSGVRPFVFCSTDDCGVTGATSQTTLINSSKNCLPFTAGTSRPDESSTILGTNSYAVDQTPNSRKGEVSDACPDSNCSCPTNITNTNSSDCTGNNTNFPGIAKIYNCGDIDPLILIGLKYSSMGRDAYGRNLTASKPAKTVNDVDYLGNADRYFFVKTQEHPRSGGIELSNMSGEITDLDGSGSSVIIRRKTASNEDVQVSCRNGSQSVRKWKGPYEDSSFDATTKVIKPDLVQKEQDDAANLAGNGAKTVNSLSSALDQLIPYNSVCSICDPGSSQCGQYGTCKDKSTIQEASVTMRGQWWTNTSFYKLNPLLFQIQCKYRRDCKERHCCKDAEPAELIAYCGKRTVDFGGANNTIAHSHSCVVGGVTRYCENSWAYKAVPSGDLPGYTFATTLHDSSHIPVPGGFPECSNGNLKGECCAPQVCTDPSDPACIPKSSCCPEGGRYVKISGKGYCVAAGVGGPIMGCCGVCDEFCSEAAHYPVELTPPPCCGNQRTPCTGKYCPVISVAEPRGGYGKDYVYKNGDKISCSP
jgi:hypothetical protein